MAIYLKLKFTTSNGKRGENTEIVNTVGFAITISAGILRNFVIPNQNFAASILDAFKVAKLSYTIRFKP